MEAARRNENTGNSFSNNTNSVNRKRIFEILSHGKFSKFEISVREKTRINIFIVIVILMHLSVICDAIACFKLRLSNGRCYNILSENEMSRNECCKHGGFFVNQPITNEQYIRDFLLQGDGIDNCKHSCSSNFEESCENIACDDGFHCVVINKRSICKCSSECKLDDYGSGPICTTSLRRFTNRCEFIKERCRSENSLLEEMDCPRLEHICYSSFIQQKNQIEHFQNVDFDESGLMLPLKVCPTTQVCIIRRYSGEANCEDPGWLGPYALDSFDVADCLNAKFDMQLCGSNNVTYENQCELRRASVQIGIEIRIAYLGQCRHDATCATVRCQRKGMECIHHYASRQPICIDCIHHPSDCNPTILPSFSYRKVKELKVALRFHRENQTFGDPRWYAKTITNGWPHVCGSNGLTFLNTCFMHLFSCYSRKFIDFISPGICPG